jgi:hypothetical protein
MIFTRHYLACLSQARYVVGDETAGRAGWPIPAGSRLTIGRLAELHGLEPALQLVDVRGPGETARGMLPGAAALRRRRGSC